MRYSFVIPVYNRPEEVRELLKSLCELHRDDFEVVVVEDGSSVTCKHVCDEFAETLDIQYHSKPNGGPGLARNYGAQRAKGEYLLIVDSDVIVPQGYLSAIDSELLRQPSDAFGGPDRAHADFTSTQKAINYSMTGFLTTGGIRGGSKKLDKFYPRSFNLGIRSDVFRALGGFSNMRFGEDIDLSIRIFSGGYSCRLFPEAWVWHKRRATLRQFFKQVFCSGMARVNLYLKYPDTLKAVHLLPAMFVIAVAIALVAFAAGLVMLPFINNVLVRLLVGILPIALLCFSCVIGIDATLKNSSLRIGLLSIAAAFVQLSGYGCGFLYAWWKRIILRKDNVTAFGKTFYE